MNVTQWIKRSQRMMQKCEQFLNLIPEPRIFFSRKSARTARRGGHSVVLQMGYG
jgi:hypothetical protein